MFLAVGWLTQRNQLTWTLVYTKRQFTSIKAIVPRIRVRDTLMPGRRTWDQHRPGFRFAAQPFTPAALLLDLFFLLIGLDETDRNLVGSVLVMNAIYLPGLARPN